MVLFGSFFILSNFHRLHSHTETCVALANRLGREAELLEYVSVGYMLISRSGVSTISWCSTY